MGVVLVHRVVGMYDGDIQLSVEGVGHPEGTELTLGVDDVRPPLRQLPQYPPGLRPSRSRAPG